MTTRIKRRFLLIWLTGFCSTDNPIFFNLAAFSHKNHVHIVHSSEIYSIRNNHDKESLYDSGHVMILTEAQCQRLSDYEKNLIELQIIIH